MNSRISRTQIDRLGDRLRGTALAESDLRLLDEYRRSFGEAYEACTSAIRDHLRLDPTGRPAKSTTSVIEKLRRETIRLSQVQDIAGCRLIVTDVNEQDRIVSSLRELFPRGFVVDRRDTPSYGYRAVHVIADVSGKLIEIQVRTSLQHFWAELSEKLSDVVDPTIKYGGGAEEWRRMLDDGSRSVSRFETWEKQIPVVDLTRMEQLPQAIREQIASTLEAMAALKVEIAQIFRETISRLQEIRGSE